jgi:hypothetical protein
MGANVNGDARLADATRELRFVVRAALGIYAQLAQSPGPLVSGRALEHGRKIIRNYDHLKAVSGKQ